MQNSVVNAMSSYQTPQFSDASSEADAEMRRKVASTRLREAGQTTSKQQNAMRSIQSSGADGGFEAKKIKHSRLMDTARNSTSTPSHVLKATQPQQPLLPSPPKHAWFQEVLHTAPERPLNSAPGASVSMATKLGPHIPSAAFADAQDVASAGGMEMRRGLARARFSEAPI